MAKAPKERWDTDDLLRRCCKALDIAKTTIMLLGAEGFNDEDTPNNRILPEKIIGETGLLLLVTSMAREHKTVEDRVEELAEMLLPYARTEKVFMEICLQPALAMEYAMAHIFLSRIGYPDRRFDALLLKSINALSHFGRERTPHRMMEQAWIKKIWNDEFQFNKHVFAGTMAHSALNKPIDLLHGTAADMYAFTHALMYATNFNRCGNKLPRSRWAILSDAEAMLARCLDDEDYDVGGEILLAWPLIGNSWSASAAFAFRVLATAEDDAGMMPAPGLNMESIRQLEGVKRDKYLYASSYHTAYVMGLLCAVSLQPGNAPPKRIRAKNPVPGSARKFLRFLEHDPQKKQWRVEFDQLPEKEQDALTGLLINIAVIRNVRQKRYGVVYEILGAAYQMDMADTALASQAAELLERLSLLS
jgi:hypothetical protein